MLRNFFYKTFLKMKEVLSMLFYTGVQIVPKPANRTFFFGYGSLMYPGGINRRGMKKVYGPTDLFQANLKGFSRSLCARSWNGLLYYGVKEDVSSVINGVAFEVLDDYDHTKLLISEGAHPSFGTACVYKTIEVTDKISCSDIPADARIFIVVPISPTDIGYIPMYYVKEVWEGIKFWGKDFEKEFLRTGGRKYDKKLSEDQILYARRAAEFVRKESESKHVRRKTGVRKNTVKRGPKL